MIYHHLQSVDQEQFQSLVRTVSALRVAGADWGHVKLQRSPRTLGLLVHLPKSAIQNISPVSWHDEHSKLTLGEKKNQNSARSEGGQHAAT